MVVIPRPTRSARTLSAIASLVDEHRAAHHEELVVNVRRRKGVQRVAAVAAEVGTLGRRADERVEAAVHDGRANRMEARRAVLAQSGHEGKPNAELIEQLFPRRRNIGRIGFKFTPGRHRFILLGATYFRYFFAYVKRGLCSC